MAIRMTTRREWGLVGPDGERGKLPPGTHEMKRVRIHRFDCHWLVLPGTLLGASEGFWRDWAAEGYGEFRIMFDDDVPADLNRRLRAGRDDLLRGVFG